MIEKQKKLKKDLKCKNFSWFLDKVWPQHFFPTKYRFFGSIKHKFKDSCLQVPTNDLNPTSSVGRIELSKCSQDSFYKKQLFVFDEKKGWLMTDDSLCVDVSQLDEDDSSFHNRANIILIACSEQERQKWKINFKDNQIRHAMSDLCLDLKPRNTNYLTLKTCDQSKRNQFFEFLPINFWNK